MGKRIVIAAFLISMALAVYVFVTRDNRSISESMNRTSVKEPRVTLEDFTAFRFKGEVMTGKLMARQGHIFEPNIVELDGEVRGERLLADGTRQMASAESSTGYFKSTSLMNMVNQTAELDRAELTGFVEFNAKGHLLTTDYAEYINKDKMVRSIRPVRIEGAGRVFIGEEGFTYDLLAQILTMTGNIKGDLKMESPDVN